MRYAMLVLAAMLVAACASEPEGPAAAASTSAPGQVPGGSVGFQERTIGDKDKPLALAIWYPTLAKGEASRFNFLEQVVARDAAVAGTGLPVVLISHGTSGMESSHADTGYALAAAGFIAVAVRHRGDNARDDSLVGTEQWLTQRVHDLSEALDYLLGPSPGKEAIDPNRIGAFGFSAGATTVLVAIGGEPDLARVPAHCRENFEFACRLWKGGTGRVPWPHEPRIRAAVIAAPGLGFAFTRENLASIRVPVQLWGATADVIVPDATNGRVIREGLPNVQYDTLQGGGHFSFLVPCPPAAAPEICSDAAGFDRAAVHRAMNQAIVAFFRRTL